MISLRNQLQINTALNFSQLLTLLNTGFKPIYPKK